MKNQNERKPNGGTTAFSHGGNAQTAPRVGTVPPNLPVATADEKENNMHNNGQKASSSSNKKRKAGEHEGFGSLRSAKPIHQVLPYVFLVLAVLFAVGLIGRLFDHPDLLGRVGNWVHTGVFGFFGYGAYLLPFLFLNLALFWQTYINRHICFGMCVLSILSAAFLSGIVCLLHYREVMEGAIPTFADLYGESGVVGGYLAYFAKWALSTVGATIVLIACLLVTFMFLVGTTPMRVWTDLRHLILTAVKKNHRKKQARIEAKKEQTKQIEEAIVKEEQLYNDPTSDLLANQKNGKAYTGLAGVDKGVAKMVDKNTPHIIPDKDDASGLQNSPFSLGDDFLGETNEKTPHHASQNTVFVNDSSMPAVDVQKAETTKQETADSADREQPKTSPEKPKFDFLKNVYHYDPTPQEPKHGDDVIVINPGTKTQAEAANASNPFMTVDAEDKSHTPRPEVYYPSGEQNVVAKTVELDLNAFVTASDDDDADKPKKADVFDQGGSDITQESDAYTPASSFTYVSSRDPETPPESHTEQAPGQSKFFDSLLDDMDTDDRSFVADTGVTFEKDDVLANDSDAEYEDEDIDDVKHRDNASATSDILIVKQDSNISFVEEPKDPFENESSTATSFSDTTKPLDFAEEQTGISGSWHPAETPSKPSIGNAVPATTGSEPKPAEIKEDMFEDEEDEDEEDTAPYVFPPLELLSRTQKVLQDEDREEELQNTARLLGQTLESFKVKTREVSFCSGPVVTRYEVRPEIGVRVRQIAGLADDIAMALAAPGGIRIEAPIPGKDAVGIEVPNPTRENVGLRELLDNSKFRDASAKLTVCLGADIVGKPVYMNLAKMPHLLIAGTTGSGKSVCINCIILSILYHASPKDCKLILIDPKHVEFLSYMEIPHLYAPIVTEPKKAAGALASAVGEMERRYTLMGQMRVKTIEEYNETVEKNPTLGHKHLPYLVIIIDELADLMLTAKDEVETSINRIAAKARAAGIHLIVGTQRPSVDVVTGVIKANIPSRIAFTVTSQTDSRTILDYAGAEKLLGMGDMLYAPIGSSKPARVQGSFVKEKEIKAITDYVRENNSEVKYNRGFTEQIELEAAKVGNSKREAPDDMGMEDANGDEDDKFADAVKLAVEAGKIATSFLQRKLGVGYGRAAKLIDMMEARGIVSAPDGNKPRQVLITQTDFLEMSVNGDFDR